MMQRQSKAEWKGTLKEGQGQFTVGKNILNGAYSFASRFETGEGTNPEELMGAAHAACYSMALSAGLTKEGYKPNRVHTVAKVMLEKVGEGFEITSILLETEADVPGIDNEVFMQQAEAAKKGCPISKALAGVKEIKLNARLLAAAK